MSRLERIRDIAIALYGLIFVADTVIRFVAPSIDLRGSDLTIAISLASVALPPAILYFFWVRWCRYVVGALSVLFFLVWCAIPAAVHEVERTAVFWMRWILVFLILGFSSVASFIRSQTAKHEFKH